MKKLSLILMTVILSLSISAQDDKMGVISIAAGPSFPFGDYGSTDLISTAGYANSGITFNIGFKYKFHEYIGMSSVVTGFTHKFDEDAVTAQNLILGTEVTTEADPWAGGAVMVGPLFSYPTGKFDFDARVMFGYAIVRRPKSVISAYEDNNGVIITNRTASGGGFALGLGAGVRFNVTDGICFLTNLDYVLTSSEITFESSHRSAFLISDFESTINQPIDMFNLTFGVGFRLN